MSAEDPKVIVALDYDNKEQALNFLKQVDPTVCRLKVGKEMFTLFGPEFVKTLVDKQFDVFLDLKFHDIPNTVAKACKAAAELGVWMVNVHASGGKPMMLAAREAIDKSAHPQTKLIAVTVLTSMDQAQLDDVIGHTTTDEQVKKLGLLAQAAGLDGVVCSGHEASMLRSCTSDHFLLVTPGIRPEGSNTGDQKRIMTPTQAMSSGVSYLVMGRPITQAAQPSAALARINQSLHN
ncbi:orotidine-5'-phosphate decarboxylase [Alteromonas lipotrueiana]|uniref:orotidine-5'-phosphate decarboxylase n=1 Tax=Alteromonas lipotrueiana TaxID=2803815 RepID=UPI001C4851BE